MSMTYGKEIKITLFGSSHSAEVGVTISGLPSGISIDVQLLQEFVYRRSARGNIGSTPRHENDLIEFVSGLEKGVTTGYEIKAIIKNTDIVSSDYDKFDELPRPSHADYVAHIKYGKAMEGGGIFSGRMTAPLCIAGGIALQVLKQKGIDIFAYISELGSVQAESYLINLSESPKMPIYDTLPLLNTEYRAKMIAEIKTAQVEGDSLGGVVECVGLNFPVGVGEPFFRSLESAISSALFSVPAVKGIDFGRGFGFGNSRGSEVNDGFVIVDGKIKTKTNNNGGINGGLSNGMPLLLRVAIKPTSSITIEQDTVNLKTKENAKIKIEGRHDVTIVPRAVPCIESAVALAVLDLMREGGFICAENNINCIRTEIDKVDDELAELLVKRQKLSSKIGILKSEKDINIVDDVRENEIIKRVATKSTGIALDDVKKIYNTIFEMSHQCQKKIAARERCEKVFLIGKPLEHSQSPEIHKQLGKYEYLLKEIDEEDVSKFLDDRQFDALNVTVPYKNYVANLMNELDDVAKRIGAVNVVKCVGDKLIGYNTDYFGFKYLLESEN
ncbi:MAG: chorismate synthase, partial [Clostridia bacterium]